MRSILRDSVTFPAPKCIIDGVALTAAKHMLLRLLFLVVSVGLLPSIFAFAQYTSKSLKKIGVLWSGAREGTADYWCAFVRGMNELGWFDGKTAKFIMRFDNDNKTQLPKLARELATLGVDVIALTSVTAPATRNAAATIPILSVDSADPIAQGLTKSLSRPIGNLTGVPWQSSETAAKCTELAKALVPGPKKIALLTDLGDPACIAEVQGCRAECGSGYFADLRTGLHRCL